MIFHRIDNRNTPWNERQGKVTEALRWHGIHIQQVRGIQNAENKSLTRLAEAIAGFAEDALGGNSRSLAGTYH
jgi:hypothetical protein